MDPMSIQASVHTSLSDLNIKTVPVQRNVQGQAPTTCTLCRRRKVKCDRTTPCKNCIRIGAECVPSVPSRRPRGRQGGRKSKRADAALLERITKLEGLVNEIEQHGGQALAGDAGPSTNITRENSENAARGFTTPKAEPSPVPADSGQCNDIGPGSHRPSTHEGRRSSADEGLKRYLGTTFWTTLSSEISGLKDILDESSDEEEDFDEGHTPSSDLSNPAQLQVNHSGFIIAHTVVSEEPVQPSRHQMHALCDVYLANVDPVFKILHAPTLRKYLQGDEAELPSSPGPRGLVALRFAIFFAAVVSLDDGECKHRMGEDKAVLLARYRAGIELALARADFINTVELSALQALTIYLVRDSTRYPSEKLQR